jgi:HD-GYP domain-containing protein (c-di-GMP phosphodiesterase class II)
MRSAALLTKALADRDPAEAGHAKRVTELALRIAEAVGAGPRRVAAIEKGAPLHDIGKLNVAIEILHKPGALDEDELAQIRMHPEEGKRMLDGIRSLRAAIECVLHHHERWDGGGYPHGLRGREIPMEARIVAVADAYDAMTSVRPYRPALTHEDALQEVRRCSGTQFDPEVAEAFLNL